jgi:anti-anti-sigma factor
MIDVQTSREGDTITARISGSIDLRAAAAFERELLAAIDKGGRHVIIDFQKVDLLTSAGIRVLVTLARRLQGKGGALVLCSLSPAVQRVFEISGLMSQFRIAASRGDAVAALGKTAEGPRRRARSHLSQVIGSLLGGSGAAKPPVNEPPVSGPRSPLSAQVVRILAGRPDDRRK